MFDWIFEYKQASEASIDFTEDDYKFNFGEHQNNYLQGKGLRIDFSGDIYI